VLGGRCTARKEVSRRGRARRLSAAGAHGRAAWHRGQGSRAVRTGTEAAAAVSSAGCGVSNGSVVGPIGRFRYLNFAPGGRHDGGTGGFLLAPAGSGRQMYLFTGNRLSSPDRLAPNRPRGTVGRSRRGLCRLTVVAAHPAGPGADDSNTGAWPAAASRGMWAQRPVAAKSADRRAAGVGTPQTVSQR
jgi:hypothetical protein